jgi:probable HAF family extracellular repeat protein
LNGAFRAVLWQQGAVTILPGSQSLSLWSLNDRGQIAGVEYGPNDYQSACVWQDGLQIHLPTLGGESGASDINNRGAIVGWCKNASGEQRATLWAGGTIHDLGSLGGSRSAAVCINDRGQIAGFSATPDGEDHAFFWQDGVMTDIGPASFVDRILLNERGQVVVNTNGPGRYHVFLWQGGVRTDLGNFGGDDAEAYALDINDRGQIVGLCNTTWPHQHAFVWQDGAMTDLGGPGFESTAHAINERGQIVGEILSPRQQAVVWQDGAMTALGGGTFSSAYDINDRGEIVGFGPAAPGAEAIHAYVWQLDRGGAHATATSSPASRTPSIETSTALIAPVSERPALHVVSSPGASPVQFELIGLPAGRYAARVFDVRGRLIRRWEGESTQSMSWDGCGADGAPAGTGMYFLSVEAQRQRLGVKVLLAR